MPMGRPEIYPIKKLIGFNQQMIDGIEAWRLKQKPEVNLSEAIRRLVELGLKTPRLKSWLRDGYMMWTDNQRSIKTPKIFLPPMET